MSRSLRHPDRSFTRCLGLLLLAALLGAAVFTPGQARPAEITYTVDTLTDAHDSNLADGICHNGVDGCSLRAAIEQAFPNTDHTTITFWSSLAGSTFHLNLGTTINWSASNTTLDGGGSISLSGDLLGADQPLLRISGSHNTLIGLTLHAAPGVAIQVGDYAGVGEGSYNTLQNLVIYDSGPDSGADAVYFYAGGSGGGQHNTLDGSVIGASSRGPTACVPGEGIGGDGVHITNGAAYTSVSGNRILCSSGFGVLIDGFSGAPNHVTITLNDIGGYGAYDLGNTMGGILDHETSYTTISSNVVSGNDNYGVWLQGSHHDTLVMNYIGLSTTGDAALGNSGCGVALTNGAHDNQVGGTAVETSRNVISGNLGHGVCLFTGVHHNLVEGNLIGLNTAGNAAVPNRLSGVMVFDSGINYIGTSAAGASQFISGNLENGVQIQQSSGVMVMQSNRIGLGTDETTALGNGQDGVWLVSAAGNAILPHAVAYNGGAGISLMGYDATSNGLWPGLVYANGDLPIDLGDDGPTENGTQTLPGPNNWQEYPLLTGGSSSHLVGTACAGCQVIIYRALGNPRAAGGGGSYLMDVTADGAGDWNADLPAGVNRYQVTLTACQAPCGFYSDTSEMSPRAKAKLYAPATWFRPR
jgi:parallel beta-helix repeat protein